jgi:hypothetical protein
MIVMIIVREKNEKFLGRCNIPYSRRLVPKRDTTKPDAICRPALTPTQTVACCHLATGTQNIPRGTSAEGAAVVCVICLHINKEILLFAADLQLFLLFIALKQFLMFEMLSVSHNLNARSLTQSVPRSKHSPSRLYEPNML